MAFDSRYEKALRELRSSTERSGEDQVLETFKFPRRTPRKRGLWFVASAAATLVVVVALAALPQRAHAALERVQKAWEKARIYHSRVVSVGSDHAQEMWREHGKFRATFGGVQFGADGKQKWWIYSHVKEIRVVPDDGVVPPIISSTYSVVELVKSLTSDGQPYDLKLSSVEEKGEKYDLFTLATTQEVTRENTHLRNLRLLMYADPETNLPVKILYFTSSEGKPFPIEPQMVETIEYPADLDDDIFKLREPPGYRIMR